MSTPSEDSGRISSRQGRTVGAALEFLRADGLRTIVPTVSEELPVNVRTLLLARRYEEGFDAVQELVAGLVNALTLTLSTLAAELDQPYATCEAAVLDTLQEMMLESGE